MMQEHHFVENAAPVLIERLDELGRVGDLQLSLPELRERIRDTPAYDILVNEHYAQQILDRARELLHMEASS
jgi:hypothetical protein